MLTVVEVLWWMYALLYYFFPASLDTWEFH